MSSCQSCWNTPICRAWLSGSPASCHLNVILNVNHVAPPQMNDAFWLLIDSLSIRSPSCNQMLFLLTFIVVYFIFLYFFLSRLHPQNQNESKRPDSMEAFFSVSLALLSHLHTSKTKIRKEKREEKERESASLRHREKSRLY